jgi:hypothetical protein
MFTCPLVRIALATQFLIDRKPLTHTPKKSVTVPTGIYDLSSGLQVNIAQTLESLERLEWEKVVPETNFFLQWDFLLAFEKNAPANMKFHYALVGDGKKNLAAFYFQVIHLSSEEIAYVIEPIASGVKMHGVGTGLRQWLKSIRDDDGFRLLISGNNFISGEYGVGMGKDAPPEKVFIALAETVKVITGNDLNPGKISAILVKDYFDDSAREAADNIRKKRYHRFIVEPEMIVPIADEWEKFEDYLGAMSKKYRNRAKSVLKKTNEIVVRELSADDLEKAETEIFNLYKNVHEKAKFRLALLSENYFTGMKREFPESFRVFGYELNGKLVAFRSAFQLQSHLEAHFIGIDYSENENFPLYQRILYDYIADGIHSGYKKVFLGRTAAEMKSTVGAVAHNLVCYTRHRNGFSNQVIRPFIDYLKPSPWTPRNPFKEV